jgi:Ser/Thr protein kinase RdoA (MazF antagonist)
MLHSLDTLLHTYKLTPPLTSFEIASGLNNAILGIHTGTGDFVLKTLATDKPPANLRYEHKLLVWLATQGLSFQTPTPVLTHKGETVVTTAGGTQLLIPYVIGERPLYTAPTQIEAMGAALAELHTVLARYPMTPRPDTTLFGLLEQTHPHLPDPYHLSAQQLGLVATAEQEELFSWWRAELANLRAFIQGPFTALPRQVIHCDYSPSNTLYANGRIVAILDFEFAGPDVRAMDLASGLVFTTRLWENPRPLCSAADFCRGYGQQQRLTAAEIEAIPWLIRVGYATSAVWWFGRGLAEGKGVYPLEKVHDMQQMVGWLADHEQPLLDILWTHLGPIAR